MTASRASVAAALAAALLLAAGTAGAQNRPRSLVPDTARSEAPARQNAGEADIRVDRLEAPGRASTGLLSAEESGLPADLWQGADRSLIAALFDRMPSYYRSATARDLARRLLLSASRIPDGRVSDTALLAQRLQLLLTMGEAQSVIGLAEATGGSIADPEVAEPLAEAQFVLGETESACDTVEAMVRGGADGYWQQASVFCDLRSNRRADAELMRSLITESGALDSRFRDLADAMGDGVSATVEAGPDMRALHLAMVKAAPSASLTRAGDLPPHLAAVVAASPDFDPAARIAAGEHAIAYAGLSPSLVMLAYDSPGAERSNSAYRGPITSAMQNPEVTGRAEALTELWRRAGEAGERDIAAGYAAGFLDKLEPSSSLTFLAPAATRMAMLRGEYETAAAWGRVLRRGASGADGESLRANTAFYPLAQVAGMEPTDGQKLGLWWSATSGEPEREARVLRVVMALDALGRPADPGLWADLLEDIGGDMPGVPDPALWRQLVMASGAGQTGIVLQSSLALIGTGRAADLDPVTLSTVVGALRRAGLTGMARQLAVEAVIAQGD